MLDCLTHPSQFTLQILETENKKGQTPLLLYVDEDRVLPDALNIFMELGADFNALDKDNFSVLATAIDSHLAESVISKLIVECGSDPNEWKQRAYPKGIDYPCSLLHIAAWCWNPEAAKVLLATAKDVVNRKDANGNTPLHWSLIYLNHQHEEEHVEVIKLLLGNGADVHALNKDGEIPLHTGLSKNRMLRYETFSFVWSKMDMTLVSPACATLALSFILRRHHNPIPIPSEEFNTMLDQLKGREPDWNNYVDDDGNTFLHSAAQCGKIDAVKYLVEEKGADINKVNAFKKTALDMAGWASDKDKSLEILSFLINREGAKVDKDFLLAYIENPPPPSPSQFHKFVEYLVGKGLTSLFYEGGGYTPLFLAVSMLDIDNETLLLLQSNGANLDAVDGKGRNILLMWALQGEINESRKESKDDVYNATFPCGPTIYDHETLLGFLVQVKRRESTKFLLKRNGLDEGSPILEIGKLNNEVGREVSKMLNEVVESSVYIGATEEWTGTVWTMSTLKTECPP